MTLFPIEQLRKMRPNWANLDGAQLLMVAAGEAMCVERFDATTYIFILEGKLTLELGGQQLPGEAGECAIIRAGDTVGIAPAGENCVALRVAEKAAPPFRTHSLAEGEPGPILLPPAAPAPPAHRRGVHLHFELDATFQPTRIADNPSLDIYLEANPGALSLGQLREYRSILRRNHQATVGLLLDVSDDEIERWFMDAMQVEHMELIHPQLILVPADLSTAEGQVRADRVRAHWTAPLVPVGMRPGVSMPMRNWSAEELRTLFSWLSKIPPATFGIVLEWTPGAFVADFVARAALETLLPWTHAVDYRGSAGANEVAHYLDGLGYQGWLLTKV